MSAQQKQSEDDRAQVLACEERRRAATVAVDIPALDALFADDLVHVHSNAMVHDKTMLLAHIAKNRAFIAIERGALDLRLFGQAAVLTGPLVNRMRRPDGSTLVMNGIATQVLHREAVGWRFVSFQLTLEPAQGGR